MRLSRAGRYSGEGQEFFVPELTRLRAELDLRAGRTARFEEAFLEAERQGAWWLALRAATSAVEHGAGDRARLAAMLDRVAGGAGTPVVQRARALL